MNRKSPNFIIMLVSVLVGLGAAVINGIHMSECVNETCSGRCYGVIGLAVGIPILIVIASVKSSKKLDK